MHAGARDQGVTAAPPPRASTLLFCCAAWSAWFAVQLAAEYTQLELRSLSRQRGREESGVRIGPGAAEPESGYPECTSPDAFLCDLDTHEPPLRMSRAQEALAASMRGMLLELRGMPELLSLTAAELYNRACASAVAEEAKQAKARAKRARQHAQRVRAESHAEGAEGAEQQHVQRSEPRSEPQMLLLPSAPLGCC